MKNRLARLDRKYLRVIRAIAQEADRQKLRAYLVGGVVRDLLLKKKILDLDIVVEGDAIGLARQMAKMENSPLTVYPPFKTASLRSLRGIPVDFSMARDETYAHPGALPSVRPGSIRRDLYRRDFTVNAMAVAINGKRFGQLIDYFDGQKDLSGKKIRVLHAQSFIDDPTRILRAVRFEQRMKFRIEPQTLRLLKSAVKKHGLHNIKLPRYFTDLRKILAEPDPLPCMDRLKSLGGLTPVDLRLTLDKRMLQRLHLLCRQAGPEADQSSVYMIALFFTAEIRSVQRALKTLPLTKKEKTGLQQARSARTLIRRLSVKRLARSAVYRMLSPLNREVVYCLLAAADRPLVRKRISMFLKTDSRIKLQIGGEDIKRLGVTSGQMIGRILKDVMNLKVDGRVRSRSEELRAAAAWIK